MYDPTTVKFNRNKLSAWYFSVSWARIQLEQRIQQFQGWGFSTSYDETQLERLLDLEQFLKMTWDERMDALQIDHAAQEAK